MLLLLHGNGSWSFLYRNMIPALRQRFRCIALDYPGFGLSSARPGFSFRPQANSAVVEAFIVAMNLSGIRLLVQDWGGPVGLGVAGRRPDLFGKLFIRNTWAWPAQGIKHIEDFSPAIRRRCSRRRFWRAATSYAEVESGWQSPATSPCCSSGETRTRPFAKGDRRRFERHFPTAEVHILRGASTLPRRTRRPKSARRSSPSKAPRPDRRCEGCRGPALPRLTRPRADSWTETSPAWSLRPPPA